MAFAIMAVALTAVIKIFGSGVNNALLSEQRTLAVQLTESLMASVGPIFPLAEGELTGTESDKYYWRIHMLAVPLPPSLAQQQNDANQNAANPNATDPNAAAGQQSLFLVTVVVSWPDDRGGMRHTEISSLKSL